MGRRRRGLWVAVEVEGYPLSWDRGSGKKELHLVLEGVQIEGSVQEILQLHQVGLLVSCGWGRSRRATSIPEHTRNGKEFNKSLTKHRHT